MATTAAMYRAARMRGCPGFGEPGSAVEAAAGLAFDGNQAQEGRGLIGGLERPAPQDRDQALGGFLAHGGDREQQVTVLAQTGMLINVVMEGGLQAGRFRFQKVDVLLERFGDRGGHQGSPRLFLPVLFPAQVGLDRVQSGDQGVQFPNLRGGGCQSAGWTKAP